MTTRAPSEDRRAFLSLPTGHSWWYGENETAELSDIALEEFDPGEYEYTIGLDDDEAQGTLSIVEALFELTVTVTDEDGAPIPDATIDVGDETVTSDDNGTAVFDLPEGAYSLETAAESYHEGQKSLTVDGDESVSISLEYPAVAVFPNWTGNCVCTLEFVEVMLRLSFESLYCLF